MAASHLKATAFAAVCLVLAIHANAYTMEQMCAQWSQDGYVGNPVDCTGWGYCKSQELVSYGNCAQGQVYVPQSSTCQFNTNAPCTTNVTQTCNVLKTPGFIADPNDCTKYAYCFGNGLSQTQSCPVGQQYAANNDTCVWGPTCPQNSICRFMPDNIFVGDPNNCGQYLQCSNGYGVWGKCQNGYYNAALGVCQTNDPCNTSPETNLPGNGVSPPATGAECTGTSDASYLSDGLTCYGYYYCAADSTVASIWGACPFGLEFDSATQECVSPISLSCTLDRCANTNLTFAAIANQECNSYTYCPTGQISSCPSDYPYFDEVYGNCVDEEPWYPICASTTSTETPS